MKSKRAHAIDIIDREKKVDRGERHVGVLEQAELVTTEKVGRVRTCKLGPRHLEEEAAWIERYRQFWGARFDEMGKVVEELKRKENVDGRMKRA